MTALLSCADVAAALGLRVSTIWRRCATRRMFPPPISYQRPYRFSAAQLARVLDGTERGPVITPRPTRRGFVRRSA